MIKYIAVIQEDNDFDITRLVNKGVVLEWKDYEVDMMTDFIRKETMDNPHIVIKVLDVTTAEWVTYKNGRIAEWYK